ncbi:MAG: cytochrome c [Rhizobiales bacterium]|nr:cytochrome c [Hyphomicrobiales bacterium]
MLIRTSIAIVAIAFGVSAVIAQSDPTAARKALMKENGAQAKAGAAMVKGEAPFDLAKAKLVFTTYADAAGKMPGLFPDNSKTGGETTAAPKIWEDMNGFKAAFAKFGSESKAAADSVKDLDSFKAAFGNVGKNCGGCHELYRIKKS